MFKKREINNSLVDEVLKHQTGVADYQKDDAYQTLDRTNLWLNSFDTKASYLLAIIGIIGTILFTTNYFSEISLKNWTDWHFVFNLLFLIILVSFFTSTLYLIKCIKPTIKNIRPDKTSKHTVLFYGSIDSMEEQMDDLKKVKNFSTDTIVDDINKQAYICSVICMRKSKMIYVAWICMITCLSSFTVYELLKHFVI
jgi:hypothetical protein